jgi:hypothetical protein
MWNRMISHCAALSVMQVVLFGLVLALGIESVTVWLRFGLGLESTRDSAILSGLTFGVRIHHGYLGLLLIVTALSMVRNPGIRNAVLMIGIGLVASDVAHHLLVLWPITGSPQFDLLYPKDGPGP